MHSNYAAALAYWAVAASFAALAARASAAAERHQISGKQLLASSGVIGPVLTSSGVRG